MKTILHDPKTGREIWRFPGDTSLSFAPYMYRRGFTADERFIIFTSNRTGLLQVWKAELETGATEPLTDVPDYVIGSLVLTLDSGGNEAYFTAGTRIVAVNIRTRETRPVCDCTGLTRGTSPISFTLAPDDSRLLFSFHHPENGQLALALVATVDGTPEIVKIFPPEVTALSHLLFCPSQPETFTYNRSPDRQNEPGTDVERARCWKYDLRTGDDVPFLTVPLGFRATHEYWNADGTRLYFHKKTVPGWTPTDISSLSRDGGEITDHFWSDTIKLGHSSVNRAETKLVSDSQEPGENPLLLIDLATGEAEILCWPNATGAPHPNHVHPTFSPSGQYILYTSDVTGTAQVYVMPLLA